MPQKLLADANRASLREITEDPQNWGTTPTSGRARARRFTSSSITVSKETATSEELRDDRMVSSVIETAQGSGGEINWEFAAGSQDLDFQRISMGTWTRPMNFDVFRGKNVSIVANNQIAIISSDDLSAYFTVGRRIRTRGFLNAQNNDYAQITAIAFAGGVTTITVASTTFTAETGTYATTVCDANDVIVLKSAAIRFGNAARKIDSNGANVFAAAVAAKQLVAGQRIFVEGIGYESGTITVTTPADGDTVTISDGLVSFAFEAQTDSVVNNANALLFAVGANATETATNIVAKINALRVSGDLNVVAKSAAGVITVINLNKAGGSITSAAASLTVAAFTGGDATAGGFYTLVAVSDDALTVDRDVPVIAVGKPITIKGAMLRNPSKGTDMVQQSASVETAYADVSQFFNTDGLRAGGVNLEVSAGAVIAGSTTMMGRRTVRTNVTKLGNAANYTVLEAAATENVSATANVGALTINDETLTTAIMSIKLQFEGNLREQRAVGSKYPRGIASGRLNVTGTVSAYFADGSLFDRFLDHKTTSLAFPIIDQDKNTYFFTIPAFKIMSDPIAPGGNDQDIMEELEFTAFRDSATKCMIQIDRFSSTTPVTAL